MRFHSGSATAAAAVLGIALTGAAAAEGGSAQQQQVLGAQTEAMPDYLWETFDRHLSRMRFIDLTHTIRPDMPIWRG
ncbi:hypothetical protein GGI11_006971, partial [Coemansia sp. RSA 2049]